MMPPKIGEGGPRPQPGRDAAAVRSYVRPVPSRDVRSDPGNRKMADYPLLKAEVQRILKLMGRERLDFLNLGITPEAWRSDAEYLPRFRSTIERLKQDGLIRFATADTFRGQETYLQMIASGGFDSIFINLNVADVAGRGRVLPCAREQGLAVLGREVFMKGELFKMGAEVGLTDRGRLAHAALRWALAVPELTCMVIGAAEPEHLEGSLAVLDAPGLNEDDRAILERLRTSRLYQTFEEQRYRESWLKPRPPESSNRADLFQDGASPLPGERGSPCA